MASQNPDRLELTRSISLAVVEKSFPEELDLFGIVWSRFLARVEEKKPGRTIGLPALGDSSAEFSAPFVVAVVWTVLGKLQHQDPLPTQDSIELALRQAGQALGVSRARLDVIVNAGAPELHDLFGLLRGETPPNPVASSAQEPLVWVEWHPNEAGVGPKEMSRAKALEDPRTKKVTLVIDEPHREFIARGKTWPFVPKKADKYRFDKRGFLVLWLALDRSNSQFRDTDINARRLGSTPRVAPSAVEHYAKEARQICRLVVGKPIVPRKDKMFGYAMRQVDWSWCWIREDPDREKSILLPKNASRENA